MEKSVKTKLEEKAFIENNTESFLMGINSSSILEKTIIADNFRKEMLSENNEKKTNSDKKIRDSSNFKASKPDFHDLADIKKKLEDIYMSQHFDPFKNYINNFNQKTFGSVTNYFEKIYQKCDINPFDNDLTQNNWKKFSENKSFFIEKHLKEEEKINENDNEDVDVDVDDFEDKNKNIEREMEINEEKPGKKLKVLKKNVKKNKILQKKLLSLDEYGEYNIFDSFKFKSTTKSLALKEESHKKTNKIISAKKNEKKILNSSSEEENDPPPEKKKKDQYYLGYLSSNSSEEERKSNQNNNNHNNESKFSKSESKHSSNQNEQNDDVLQENFNEKNLEASSDKNNEFDEPPIKNKEARSSKSHSIREEDNENEVFVALNEGFYEINLENENKAIMPESNGNSDSSEEEKKENINSKLKTKDVKKNLVFELQNNNDKTIIDHSSIFPNFVENEISVCQDSILILKDSLKTKNK